MSSQGEEDPHVDGIELTDDEYSEKFSRPNSNRLQKEKSNQSKVQSQSDLKVHFSNDNPSFIRDEDPEEQPPSNQTIPDPQEKRNVIRKCMWVIIVILLILVATMTALFIWRMICYQNKEITKPVPSRIEEPTKEPVQSGCFSLPRPTNFPKLPANIQKELKDFKSFLIDAVDKNQTVAVSANVIYRDKVIMEGAFGIMNKAEKPTRSPTVETIYPCASVSKVLTVLMLLKQVNDKKVRSLVDDTVVNYETNFKVNNPFDDHKITFWELARQMSGLPREAPCYPNTASNLCPHSYDTMINRLRNVSLVQKPGKVPQYSNLGFGVLGQVLFKKFASSEATFGLWMKKNLLSKLDMMNSSFSVNASQKSNIPIGYLDDMTSSHPIQDWGWLQPAGGVFTSVGDLAKLQIELMGSNWRIISYELQQEFFKPDYVFPDGNLVGSPWQITRTDKGYLLREKYGYIYGYSSYIVMVPELRLGLNLMCTGCNSKLGNAGRSRFLRIMNIFHEELTRATVKNLTMPPNPKLFIGRYNSSIPVISYMQVKEKKAAENKFLVLAVNGAEMFFLDYKAPLTFHIVMNPQMDCTSKYLAGVQNDVVIFDKSSNPNGTSPGFVMYGAHPSGRSYFYRQ